MMRMMRFSECYEEIEYRRGKVIRRRRGSSGNVRLSHLLIWVSCLNKCCEPKQRFLHVWHGIDHQIIIDNAVDEWRGRLRACAGKRRTLRATIVTIFSHMRRDVSVLCQQFLDSFFGNYHKFELPNFARKCGNILKVWWYILFGFCWKFTSLSSSERILKIRWRSYRHEFGVLLFGTQCITDIADVNWLLIHLFLFNLLYFCVTVFLVK